MREKQSAGLLVHRTNSSGRTEVFLVHPGGPYWAKKDLGSWSIPKGEFEDGEGAFETALREFEEETGQKPPRGTFTELKSIKTKRGKTILSWAVTGNPCAGELKSNHFEMEWPKGSGKICSFPEVDRGEWFDLDTAKLKINQSQCELVLELGRILAKKG